MRQQGITVGRAIGLRARRAMEGWWRQERQGCRQKRRRWVGVVRRAGSDGQPSAPPRRAERGAARGGRAICSGSKAGAERPRNSARRRRAGNVAAHPRQATRRGPQSRGPQRAAARVGVGSRAGARAKQ